MEKPMSLFLSDMRFMNLNPIIGWKQNDSYRITIELKFIIMHCTQYTWFVTILYRVRYPSSLKKVLNKTQTILY